MVTLLFLNKHYDFHIFYDDFSHFCHNKQQSSESSQHTDITGSSPNAGTQTAIKGTTTEKCFPQNQGNVFKPF